jgi:hypothetical protein
MNPLYGAKLTYGLQGCNCEGGEGEERGKEAGEGTRKKVGELEVVCSKFVGMTQILIRSGWRTLS